MLSKRIQGGVITHSGNIEDRRHCIAFVTSKSQTKTIPLKRKHYALNMKRRRYKIKRKEHVENQVFIQISFHCSNEQRRAY